MATDGVCEQFRDSEVNATWADDSSQTERVQLAVEDRFVILKLWEEHSVLPSGFGVEAFLETLRSVAAGHQIICDLRGAPLVSDDIKDFFRSIAPGSITSRAAGPADFFRPIAPGGITGLRLLIGRHERHTREYALHELKVPQSRVYLVDERPIRVNYTHVDLSAFDRYGESGHARNWRADRNHHDPLLLKHVEAREQPATQEEMAFYRHLNPHHFEEPMPPNWPNPWDIGDDYQVKGRRYLAEVLERRAYRSVMGSLCLAAAGGQVAAQPYHGQAFYQVELADDLVLARPSVIAAHTGRILRPVLEQFEALLNTAGVREGAIQTFLERHPVLLESLGYRSLRAQVVLEREDGSSMRPDFMLEPASGGWWDILDIKRPQVSPLIVGSRDRKGWSQAVMDLVNQLREYSAYFEDERLSKRVEDKYGIKCYRPKLIGVIGRDQHFADERQVRRLQTMYADATVLTFDTLVDLARRRLLI